MRVTNSNAVVRSFGLAIALLMFVAAGCADNGGGADALRSHAVPRATTKPTAAVAQMPQAPAQMTAKPAPAAPARPKTAPKSAKPPVAAKPAPAAPKPQPVRFPQYGVASYYAHKFHGRKTANGERFDMNGISAAHQTLPLGTIVRVTNFKNGRSLEIRINDRGPFVDERVIDLSLGAAKKLGMVHQGLTDVMIEIVKLPPPRRTVARAG
jgi:rare lipoprotein A